MKRFIPYTQYSFSWYATLLFFQYSSFSQYTIFISLRNLFYPLLLLESFKQFNEGHDIFSNTLSNGLFL
jgi:hypothetical protein